MAGFEWGYAGGTHHVLPEAEGGSLNSYVAATRTACGLEIEACDYEIMRAAYVPVMKQCAKSGCRQAYEAEMT